ncbi:hypothetical protein C10C_0327 [Chlamydia serpentis]|uniref:Uncharacterized protein n=1 Tax=Chlamydia serpentis TaxID=1967782 RepID=A0A2R8FAP1_9CHLA|nr:hypothetical protein [Chlamydia serpentis]SPN73500.1 hypothetical protein C10C_0327 [Chlamydia serpentis]
MSISPLGILEILDSSNLKASCSSLPKRLKEWFPMILFLILGGVFTIAGCIVMMLTKQILYALLCVLGGILLAIGLLLKPETVFNERLLKLNEASVMP